MYVHSSRVELKHTYKDWATSACMQALPQDNTHSTQLAAIRFFQTSHGNHPAVRVAGPNLRIQHISA